MNWVLQTFIYVIVITAVLNLIVNGIYRLTSKNRDDEED